MTHLFKSGSIVIAIGPGGVGKTTIAAALGLATARAGLPTAVLTIDPAHRLREALGLGRLGARPRQLDARRLQAAGLDTRLPFSASTLDVKATWDGMVERFVRAPAARKQIFENGFYRNLTERFAGAESYAALEQLRVMHEAAGAAVTVVDTPPATHAFDFLEAPDHLARLLDSQTARWLLSWTNLVAADRAPLGSRLAKMILTQLEEFAGARPLSAIAEFFGAAAGSLEAIRLRMLEAAVLLHSPAVSFMLVTTAEDDRLSEAAAIVRRLAAEKLRLAAVVINRVAEHKTFAALAEAPGQLPPYVRAIAQLNAIVPADRARPITRFLEEHAAAQAASIIRAARFARDLPPRTTVVLVPQLERPVTDLPGLIDVADWLTSVSTGRRFLDQAARTLAPRPTPA